MKQATSIRRIALSLAAAAAILGGIALGFAVPQGDSDAHAAKSSGGQTEVVKW